MKIISVEDTGKKLSNGATIWQVFTDDSARPHMTCFSNRVKDLQGQDLTENTDFTVESRDYQGKPQYTLKLIKSQGTFQGSQFKRTFGKSEKELQLQIITMAMAYAKDATDTEIVGKVVEATHAEYQKYLADNFGFILGLMSKKYKEIADADNK